RAPGHPEAAARRAQGAGRRPAHQGAHGPRPPLQRQGAGADRGARRQGRADPGVEGMLQALRNIWDIPDLRKRVLFTLGLLAVYRIGNHVPTPGINAQSLIDFFEQNRGNWFGLVDMFSGGNLAKVTIFALGIMPYISASIILQLLAPVWPSLEKLSKEGELGRRKITQYTRYGTVLLSIVQSFTIAVYLERLTLANQFRIVDHPGWGFRLMTVLTLTTGTAFIMWLGEQITERGVGNGMSLTIFAGIVV